MKRLSGLLLLTLFLTVACETTDHEGFKRLDRSIHVKLVELGEEDQSIQADRYVTLFIRLLDLQGKEQALKRVKRIRFDQAQWPDAIEKILMNKGEGDRLLIRGRLDELGLRSWFEPVTLGEDAAVYELRVHVMEVLTDEELRQERAEERSAQDLELEALQCMAKARDSLGLNEQTYQDGIYFLHLIKGRGERPTSGKMALVQYKTYLCDGTLIDDTYRAEAFEYPIGKPDQVLPGFAVAISKMHAGDKARFLIPSELAFGEKGSSSGLVPPHAALIYEAELLEVR